MIFNQIFRIAFVTVIWKNYKAWIASTTLLLLSFYLIGKIHTDLLQYWALQEDNTQTASSILYKWLAYLLSGTLYCLYHFFRPKVKATNSPKQKKAKRKKLERELSELPPSEDPFNEIRKRGKLRSQADLILDKQARKN